MEERAPQAQSACGSCLSIQPVLADLLWTTRSDTQTADCNCSVCKEEGPTDIREPLNRKISTNEKKNCLGLENERQKTWMKVGAAVMKVIGMVLFAFVSDRWLWGRKGIVRFYGKVWGLLGRCIGICGDSFAIFNWLFHKHGMVKYLIFRHP